MKTARFLKAMFMLGVVAACAGVLAACSGGANANSVAATVNGVDIAESDVTQQVHTMRVQNQLDDDQNWGLYLAMTNQTPTDVRTTVIESLKNRELRKEGAPDLGITLDASEVDIQIQSMKANYDSDEKWNEALSSAGWTPDQYQAFVEDQVLTTQIAEYFEGKAEVDDDTILETAKNYGSAYYNGLKRSSHILFKVDDVKDEAAMAAAREKAQDVLDRINSGELSFEDAAQQYSDDSSKDKGGDVGWSNQDFVSEYLEAVNGLEVGEVSGLVESQFGIHIIKVTDKFEAPEEITSLDQLPTDFHQGIKDAAANVKAQNDYNEWLQGLSDEATFTQNDMPSGLPYDIDLTKYQEQYEKMKAENEAASAEDETTEEGAGAESGDESGESASSESASAPSESAESESSDGAAASGESASAESASSEDSPEA